MAIIKRKELAGMPPEQRKAKIAELEKAILELRGEGRKDKVKPLKKAIARLLTPPPAKETTSQKAPSAPQAQKTPSPKPVAAQSGTQHPATGHPHHAAGHPTHAAGPQASQHPQPHKATEPQPLKTPKTK